MLAVGIGLMAAMMIGMMSMHMGGHGHSGHADMQNPPGAAVSTATATTHQMEKSK